MDAAFTPTDFLYRKAENRVEMEWADGHHSVYPVPYLRQNCPCARCVIVKAKTRAQRAGTWPQWGNPPGRTGPLSTGMLRASSPLVRVSQSALVTVMQKWLRFSRPFPR